MINMLYILVLKLEINNVGDDDDDCSKLHFEEECKRAQGCNWDPYNSVCF